MHGPHVNYTTDDTKIDISFNPGNISIEKTFFNEITPPTDLIDYFATTQKGTFILRRTQILAFISSQPGDRFRALASIIGVDTLDEIELEMKRASDHIVANSKTLEKNYNDLFVELTVLLEIETKKPEEILPNLNVKLKNDGFPEMKLFEHLKTHTEDLLRKVKIDSKKDDRIKNLNEIIDYSNHSLLLDHIENKLVDYSTKFKELLDKNENIKNLLSLEAILKEGKEFIKSGNDNFCPLCEQSVDKDDLVEKIEKRLNIFRDLSNEASEVHIAGDILIDETKSINDKISNLTTKLDKIEEFSDHKKNISDYKQKLGDILNELSNSKDLKQKFDLKHIDQYREIDAEWKKINIEAKQLIQKADLTEEEKQTLTLINLLNNVNSKNTDVNKAQKDISQTKYRNSLAKKIYNTFYKTKNSKIQQIYKASPAKFGKGPGTLAFQW